MNSIPPPIRPPENRLLERFQAGLEVLLLSGLVSGFFAAIPFSYRIKKGSAPGHLDTAVVVGSLLLDACITFILLWIVMHAHRERLQDFGMRAQRWKEHAVVGLALVPVLFFANALITQLFRLYLPQFYLDRNPLTEVIKTPFDLGFFILSAWIAGGIKEELQRAFILTRFRHHLGGSGLGLFVWSVAFGAGHYVQGLQGMVAATLFGFLFGAVYLMRRSLVAPIVAHGVYDTLALLGYWYYRN